MKKFLAFCLLLLNFLVLPNSVAEDEVVIDRITKSEAEDLNIVIPENVPPGFHSFTIEVYDDKGTVSKKQIPFCKDNEGIVQWDNKCPNLVLSEETEPVPVVNTNINLNSYDPISDPETTKDLQLGALAALMALASAKKQKESKDEGQEQDTLESVGAGKIELLKDDPGWGDSSRTWKNRFTPLTDAFVTSLAHRFNGHSPLLTRIVQDGNTVRAIIGSWGFLLIPFGFVLGVVASLESNLTALPPYWMLVAAIVGIAVFDAFAGLVAGFIFLLLAILNGNISSRPELLTAIALMILFFAPALLASTFRPFRRLVRNRDDLWERISDYALGTLLTFWVVTLMISAMNGLARKDLPITQYKYELGIVCALLLVTRMALEDLAVEHYPRRLKKLFVDIKEPTKNQRIVAVIVKTDIFALLAAPFVQSTLNLMLGILIFVIPLITGIVLEDNLPKKKLNLPTGVLKTLLLVFVMALVGKWIEGLFESAKDFLKWNFVVLALPGLFLHYLDAITDEPKGDWKTTENGRKIYRVGGVIVFILMVLVVMGVDLASWIS
jgi:hypothetical protein